MSDSQLLNKKFYFYKIKLYHDFYIYLYKFLSCFQVKRNSKKFIQPKLNNLYVLF